MRIIECARESREGSGVVVLLSRERGVAVVEEDTDEWAPSVRERRRKGAAGCCGLVCWVDPSRVGPVASFPFFSSFFLFFSVFLSFCIFCINSPNKVKPIPKSF
jgi:hypothetical protein